MNDVLLSQIIHHSNHTLEEFLLFSVFCSMMSFKLSEFYILFFVMILSNFQSRMGDRMREIALFSS